ncbi:uncharacterized protein LOC119671677 [Teleopsis dalmanni]|uniref:uncharacterized protein LOC119671677 n=1 Tax=Teleopsis dalmanni TaxID=139649 RepID=UPI0018CF41A5|nr:uncharacterized protein LOC119671677 [Teleopsis dalmanni]
MERKLKQYQQLRSSCAVNLSNKERTVEYVQYMNMVKASNIVKTVTCPDYLNHSVSLSNIMRLNQACDVNTDQSSNEHSIPIKSTSLSTLMTPSTVTLTPTDSNESFNTVKSEKSSNLSIKTCCSTTSFFKASDMIKRAEEPTFEEAECCSSSLHIFPANNNSSQIFLTKTAKAPAHQYEDFAQNSKKNQISRTKAVVTQTSWSAPPTEATLMPSNKNSFYEYAEPISKPLSFHLKRNKGPKQCQLDVSENKELCASRDAYCSTNLYLKEETGTKPKSILTRRIYSHCTDPKLYRSCSSSIEDSCTSSNIYYNNGQQCEEETKRKPISTQAQEKKSRYKNSKKYQTCSSKNNGFYASNDVNSVNTQYFEEETDSKRKLIQTRGKHTRCKEPKLYTSRFINNGGSCNSRNVYTCQKESLCSGCYFNSERFHSDDETDEIPISLEWHQKYASTTLYNRKKNARDFKAKDTDYSCFEDEKAPSSRSSTSSSSTLSNGDIISAVFLKRLNEILTEVNALEQLIANKGKGDAPIYAQEILNSILGEIPILQEHLLGVSVLLTKDNSQKFRVQLQEAFVRVQQIKKQISKNDEEIKDSNLNFNASPIESGGDMNSLQLSKISYAFTPTSTKMVFKKKYRDIIKSSTELLKTFECSTAKVYKCKEPVMNKPAKEIVTIKTQKRQLTTIHNDCVPYTGNISNRSEEVAKSRKTKLNITSECAARSGASIYNIFQRGIRKQQEFHALNKKSQKSDRTFIIAKTTPTDLITTLEAPTPFVDDSKAVKEYESEVDSSNTEQLQVDSDNEIVRRTVMNPNTKSGRCGSSCFRKTSDNKFKTSYHMHSHVVLRGEEINGEDVVITNICNSIIEIQGTPNSLEIREVWNCLLACGPVAKSIKIFNCREAAVMVAGRKLSIKSSSLCFLLLYITHRTTLRKSTGLLIGPYSFYYKGIENDFIKTVITCTKTKFNIVDYSNKLKQNSSNWGFLPECHVPNWNSVNEDFKKFVYSQFPR